MGNVANYKFDLLGLAGATTHGTNRCKSKEPCDVLALKLAAWILHYNERHQELMFDKYNYKQTNPRRYNNHIKNLEDAEKNIYKCVKFLSEQIANNECKGKPPCIPVINLAPIPARIPVSQVNINWDAMKKTAMFGGATIILFFIPFDGPAGEATTTVLTLRYASQILIYN